MEHKKLSLWPALSVAVVLSLVMPWAVLADVVQPDNDLVTTGDQEFLNLGSVSPGATLTAQVSFTLKCEGRKHVDYGQLVALTYSSLKSTVPSDGTMAGTAATIGAVPGEWPDDTNACPTPAPGPIGDNGNSTVTIKAPVTAGTYTYVAKYDVGLTPSGNDDPSSITGNVQVTFQLTVVSNTAPSLSLPDSMTVEGNTIGGATVSYTATATDAEDDPDPVPSCTPASGSYFPLGTTIVSCSVTDSGGLTTTGTFNVTVEDTTAPVLVNMPADMTVEGNTEGGADVMWDGPTATDAVDADPSVICSPASGSFLPLGGPHVVTCTASDASGNSINSSFNVTVVDTTPPTLADVPADMTVEGNTIGGANVSWASPTATDIVDPSPTVGCDPTSGSFFALGGPHEVTCTASDASGNSSSDSFNVTVVDTTPPAITCPADVSGYVGDPVYLGLPTVADIVDADPAASNDAPNAYPPGTTQVVWTATDDSGNSSQCAQQVTLIYHWTGFFMPVDNRPIRNVAKAGSSVPVKFNLGGYQGLGIFVVGYPKLYYAACDAEPTDEVETYTAGQSSLTYDFTAQQYVYVWKTDRTWAGKCGYLEVKLIDGTSHYADFKFK